MSRALLISIAAAAAAPLLAAGIVVGLLRVYRRRRARLDREAHEAFARTFAERGGARVLHAGYDPVQQSAATRRARQDWEARLRVAARRKTARPKKADVVSIESRKAGR